MRNAFRPKTTAELFDALLHAREDDDIGVVLLSAEGPSLRMENMHFVAEAIRKQEENKVTLEMMALRV